MVSGYDGSFNVVDVHELASELGVPVLVVMRRIPDLDSVRRALFSDDPPGRERVRGAARTWRLIVEAGAIEPLTASKRALRRAGVSGSGAIGQRLWVQRVGLSLERAHSLVRATTCTARSRSRCGWRT